MKGAVSPTVSTIFIEFVMFIDFVTEVRKVRCLRPTSSDFVGFAVKARVVTRAQNASGGDSG